MRLSFFKSDSVDQQQEREKQDAAHAAEHYHLPFDQQEAVQRRQKEERERLDAAHARQLHAAYQRSTFANAWNWIDAYLREEHGKDSQVYFALRQALMSRRVLLLLDGHFLDLPVGVELLAGLLD